MNQKKWTISLTMVALFSVAGCGTNNTTTNNTTGNASLGGFVGNDVGRNLWPGRKNAESNSALGNETTMDNMPGQAHNSGKHK